MGTLTEEMVRDLLALGQSQPVTKYTLEDALDLARNVLGSDRTVQITRTSAVHQREETSFTVRIIVIHGSGTSSERG